MPSLSAIEDEDAFFSLYVVDSNYSETDCGYAYNYWVKYSLYDCFTNTFVQDAYYLVGAYTDMQIPFDPSSVAPVQNGEYLVSPIDNMNPFKVQLDNTQFYFDSSSGVGPGDEITNFTQMSCTSSSSSSHGCFDFFNGGFALENELDLEKLEENLDNL
jgi:hypothetical protein